MQTKTAAQIAALVFKAMPHINQVWVNETTQHHYLHNTPGSVLIQQTNQINAAQVTTPGAVKTKKKKTKWQ